MESIERSILGTITQSKELFFDVYRDLSIDLFSEHYSKFYQLVEDAYKAGSKPNKSKIALELNTNLKQINEILNEADSSNLVENVQILKSKYKKHKVTEVSYNLIDELRDCEDLESVASKFK